MKFAALILIAVMSFSLAQAKTLLISDIDDTIKNSHVLDVSDAIFTVDKVQNAVLGISELYNAAKQTDPDLQLYYVTNAPLALMEGTHRAFLLYNDFPQGNVRLRRNVFQSDFKLKEIRNILKTEKPESVILIGDNGEKDVEVYAQIVREFPGIQFTTYIRQLYWSLSGEDTGAMLKFGQTGFATALDLTLQFRAKGLVAPAIASNVIREFISAYSKEYEMNDDGPQAIPSWLDCRDFVWTARDLDLLLDLDYQKTKLRILERCVIPALED